MTLHHRDEGSGPAVLLLHAGVADHRMWDAQVAELVPGHRVVRPDLRGFGHTPLGPAGGHADARDVLDLLDGLGIEECALVAASYGGWVALQAATAAPRRFSRLVLLDPLAEVAEPDDALRGYWGEEGRLVEAGELDAAAELTATTFLGPDATRDAHDLVVRMQRTAYELGAAAPEVQSDELPVDLDAITMPVTVVAGAHDLPFFRTTATELVRRLPDATLVELGWAGHLPSLERPLETAHLVRAALAD